MNRLRFGLRFVVCAALISTAVALAQQPATPQAGPIPQSILAAQKAFVSNAGPVTEHISYYSGGPNRVYDEFYAALKASGKFEITGDQSDADLVLEPRVMTEDGGGATLRLVIYDRKTHYVLWSLLEPIKPCVLQKACESNFEAALPARLLDFEKLTGKFPIAAH